MLVFFAIYWDNFAAKLIQYSQYTNFLSLYSIEFVNELESTNTYLKEKVRSHGIAAPYCVSAGIQSNGRGQRGNTWESEPFANVTASFLVGGQNDIADLSRLVNVAAVAVVNCLSKIGVTNVAIKWPNDVYVNEKKIAGVLIENVVSQGMVKNSVVGIGLNVNQEDFGEHDGTSLFLETNEKREVASVLNSLYDEFYSLVSQDSPYVLEQVNAVLFKKNQSVTFDEAGRLVEYKVLTLLKNGNLLAENSGEYKELEHHKSKWIK
ncbi:MAG: biotin--[acetyl-CoA-carboxylase] ligase [Bacteroidia bacterium]